MVTRPGACPQAGSSGGPLYQVRPDGGVIAEGIISAAGPNPNDSSLCDMEYTDIGKAMSAWPGSQVKTMVARPSNGMAVNTQGDFDRLYVRSTAGVVQEKTRSGEAASPTWSAYGTGTGPSGTTPASDPMSIVDSSGTVWVFIQGANGNLYERHLTNSVWSSWTSLGTGLAGTPSAVVDKSGILRVYVRTSSGMLCEDYKRPGQAWSGKNYCPRAARGRTP